VLPLLAACDRPLDGGPMIAAPSDRVSPDATTDCGTFTLGQGEHLPADAAQCLISAARTGRPAKLAVTRPTTEGDPIPMTYTARDGKVEVLTDTRADNFGPKTLTLQTCTGPGIVDREFHWDSCSELQRLPV
jgi:hypothetical protein